MQQNHNKNTAKKSDNSIVEVLTKYLAYWPLFLVFFIIIGAGAFLYMHFTVPKYEAAATIIIKDENKGDKDSKLMEDLNIMDTKKIVENEIEVLQSWTLMNTVVKKLHLYAPVSRQGSINSVSGYISSPLLVESPNPDTISTEYEKIMLDYDQSKGIVALDTNFKCPINQWVKTPYGTLRFVPNEKYRQPVEQDPLFFSISKPKSVAVDMLTILKVAASNKLSSVIDLTYRNEVPKLAEDVLNELIAAYSDAALKEKNTLAKNTLAFIEVRLNAVSKDLDSIEKKLQQYKTSSGTVDISRQAQVYLDNVSTNDKKLTDLNMQAQVLDQLEKAATNPGNTGMLPSTLGVTDPTLLQQMNNLNDLQMQYDKLKTTVAENNPLLVSVTEQINRIKPTILTNIQSQRKSLEQSRATISASGGSYNSVLSSLPQKEKEIVEISRDQNIKQVIYSFLLQKREESELSYASTLSDSRVVNYAQATEDPVSPKKIIIIAMALVLALGFPIAFITGREVLSPKILYRHEIDSATNVPIIGEISHNKLKDKVVVEAGRRTVIAEEFRKIRASLLSLGINSHHKKVLVTSSISGEGKSFIASNLAISISLTGKKVVLVDMDLHDPTLGKFFGVKDQPGVTDYLVGKASLNSIIYNIPGNDNLFYISSGTPQADSSELLENGKVQTLIAQLDADFDLVLIDTAPVVLITDAYLLSSLCDATLYVVRHKFTPKTLIKRMDENMLVNPIKNPGIVFNGVKTRGFFKSNYGYGYNNHVYSYATKKKKKKSIT